MSDEIKVVEKALGDIQTKLDTKLAEHTAEIEKHGKAAVALTGEVDKLSQKYAEAEAKLDDLCQKAANGFGREAEQPETLGRIFTMSDEFKNLVETGKGSARVEVKNTIIGEGGSPQNPVNTIVPQDRLPGIVPGAFRALGVLDFFPAGSTSSNQVEYTAEDTFTNNAAERAEGVAKPETDLTFKLVNDPVRTIAHFIKASKQVLDDAPALETYINRRLTHGVRNRLEFQILRGNGTSPNIAGLSASGRHTAFTPATGDTALVSLNKAKYAVIAADYNADVIFMNPADWGALERAQAANTGVDVGVSYIQSGLTPRIWGLPVVTSNNVEAGKFYCLASSATQLFTRQGVAVEMGYVNDDFTKNLITIRAEMRAALATFVPAAIRYGSLVL